MPEVFIGMGSNMEPELNIRNGLEHLKRLVAIKALSTFYRTLPIGGHPGDASFINGVAAVITGLSPGALRMAVLREIEKKLGRRRGKDRSAPRPLDLDIILYGDLVLHKPGIIIPDPALYTRPFLALPLYELSPRLVIPGSGIPIATVAEKHREHDMTALKAYSDELRREFTHEHGKG